MLDQTQSDNDLSRRCWKTVRAEIEFHMRAIWAEPELPCMEAKAAELLCAWLTKRNFTVERSACGIPTAFIARKNLGRGPTIALLAEYDALPGTDNDAVPFKKSRGKRAGHACGHNQIGPANIGAAIGAAMAAEALGVGGEIVVLGCPAEEIVWGKVALLQRGAFDGIDAILTSHGDYQNGAMSRPCQAVVSGEIAFHGESGHGGGIRKKNALDAAELAVQSIERLRAHHFSDTSVEHVLRLGGHIPNVTPDEARLWISTRHVEFGRARSVHDFVIEISRRAAEMADVGFRHQFIASTHGYLPNDILAECLFRSLQIVGSPRWSAEDKSWMTQLSEACRPATGLKLDEGLNLYKDGYDLYGQDDGEVSWRIPLGRVNWAYPESVPLHNWAMTALTGSEASFAGPLMASEAIAIATLELLRSPGTIEEARIELGRRTTGVEIPAPNIGAWQTMISNPESFWDGRWSE